MSLYDSMGTVVDGELSWDAEIEKDSADFILLPEGEYEFTVTAFERARYAGGEKLPACNQAKLKLQVEVPEGTTTLNQNLFLHSRMEGKLSEFFNCIGQKKHGEKVQMNWGQVIGSKGRAKVGIKTYNDKQYNEVKKFIDPGAATQSPGGKNFKAGSF